MLKKQIKALLFTLIEMLKNRKYGKKERWEAEMNNYEGGKKNSIEKSQLCRPYKCKWKNSSRVSLFQEIRIYQSEFVWNIFGTVIHSFATTMST